MKAWSELLPSKDYDLSQYFISLEEMKSHQNYPVSPATSCCKDFPGGNQHLREQVKWASLSPSIYP